MTQSGAEQVKADAESRLRYQHNGDGLAYIQRYQDEEIVEVCKRVRQMEEALQAHFDEYCLAAQLYRGDEWARDRQSAKAVAVDALAKDFGVQLDLSEWDKVHDGRSREPSSVSAARANATRVRQMEEALRLVDAQVPDAIGGENYLISPGALYAVKAALDLLGSREPEAEEGEA